MIQSVRMRGAGDSRLVYNGGSRKQRGLLKVAGSSGDPDGAAGTAFGGQAAINQYGAAWSVNSAPAFPIDLFLVSNTGTVSGWIHLPCLALVVSASCHGLRASCLRIALAHVLWYPSSSLAWWPVIWCSREMPRRLIVLSSYGPCKCR